MKNISESEVRNYCIRALKREWRSSIMGAALFAAIGVTFLTIITINYKAILNQGESKVTSVFWLIVIWIVLLATEAALIRRTYRVIKNVENTELVKSIRRQLPEYDCNEEIDHIFSILDADFANARCDIGNFCMGSEWMLGSSVSGSAAIKYENIERYHWIRERGDDDSRTKRYLYIVCMGEGFRFAEKGSHEVFLKLQKMLPDKELTRAKSRDALCEIYNAMRNKSS